MEKLRAYLNSLTPSEQEAFAERCDTSLSYLRKAISKKHNLGMGLVICIERESAGQVRGEDLLPDLDWKYLRTRSAVPVIRSDCGA